MARRYKDALSYQAIYRALNHDDLARSERRAEEHGVTIQFDSSAVVEGCEDSRQALDDRLDFEMVYEPYIDGLPDRSAAILRAYYGIGETEKTLEQIGRKHRVTRDRARQIAAKAERTIGHPARMGKHAHNFHDPSRRAPAFRMWRPA